MRTLISAKKQPSAMVNADRMRAVHVKAWGRIASLIETAKINGIEPFAYLKATLEAIARGHPQSRINELLPWNFKLSS